MRLALWASGEDYLLLDAILNDCCPIQSQETLLRQVPHQADNGLLTALGGDTLLLLLVHDHLLNPGYQRRSHSHFNMQRHGEVTKGLLGTRKTLWELFTCYIGEPLRT